MSEQPTVTLQDLAMVVNLIDLVTKRGAFEGNELLPVGTLRERIAAYLNAQQAAAEAAQKAAPGAEATDDEYPNV